MSHQKPNDSRPPRATWLRDVSAECAGKGGSGDSVKRMQQTVGIASRRAHSVLTDKPVYRDQALGDGIDGEEKTFESDGGRLVPPAQ